MSGEKPSATVPLSTYFFCHGFNAEYVADFSCARPVTPPSDSQPVTSRTSSSAALVGIRYFFMKGFLRQGQFLVSSAPGWLTRFHLGRTAKVTRRASR